MSLSARQFLPSCHVAATGISSCECLGDGTIVRMVRVRRAEDVTVIAKPGHSITGPVAVEGCGVPLRPCTFELRYPGANMPVGTWHIACDSEGRYELPDIPQRKWDVTAKVPGYLRGIVAGVVVDSYSAEDADFFLLGGDLDGDNCAGQRDFDMMKQSWFAKVGDPNWNELADPNCDGTVNAGDCAILVKNWGKCGAP